MKSFLLFIFLLMGFSLFAQLAINTDGSAPDNSAMLDVKSISKGLLAPRLSEAQRLAIASPATGLIVYQTDATNGYYYNAGTPASPNWRIMSYDGSTWLVNGSNIYRNTGNVGIGTSTPTMKLEVSEDVKINGLRVGRGSGGPDGNIALGNGALNTNDIDGFPNIAIGYRAMYSNTNGDNNNSVGYYSMFHNTTGSNNCAFGQNSMMDNTTGNSNTAIGSFSLSDNTTGIGNAAVGYTSGMHNTTGSYNSSLGYSALHSNETGYSNIAIGNFALQSNDDRSNLIAIGDSALYYNGMNNTSEYHGTDNTAIGSKSLWFNTLGYRNIAVGNRTLRLNSEGYANTAIGYLALTANTTGIYNMACGRGAMESLTSGGYNTAVGTYSGYNRTDMDFGTYVGSYAYPNADGLSNTGGFGYNARPTASDQIRIGNSSVSSIGGYAGWTDFSDGRYKMNINENVSGLEFVMKLRPLTYQLDVNRLAADLHENEAMDRDGGPSVVLPSEQLSRDKKAAIIRTGFIAQEVEEAAKSIGYNFSGVDAPKNEKDYYGLRYAEFVVPLVKAVQEQQQLIEKQQQQIDELRYLIEQLAREKR